MLILLFVLVLVLDVVAVGTNGWAAFVDASPPPQQAYYRTISP